MPFGREILLRNVKCLRAWVDLFHFALCVSTKLHYGESHNFTSAIADSSQKSSFLLGFHCRFYFSPFHDDSCRFLGRSGVTHCSSCGHIYPPDPPAPQRQFPPYGKRYRKQDPLDVSPTPRSKPPNYQISVYRSARFPYQVRTEA